MSPLLTCVSLLGNVLVPSGAVGLALSCARDPALRATALTHADRLEQDLRVLQLRATGTAVVRVQLSVAAGLVALAALLASPWPCALVPLIALAPGHALRRARQRRTARVEQQLDAFLLALANGLKASPSLGDALAACVPLIASPLREELALVLREQQLGVPLDRALERMAARVQSPVVTAAIATLRVARNTGGNLNRALERAAASLRELARLAGVVRTKTAEGRAQTVVIAAIPLPLVWGLQRMDPDFLTPVWSTATGHVVLAGAVALWAVAVLLARAIIEVDV